MADTVNVVSIPLTEESNTEKRSEVDSTVPGVTSADSTDATSLTEATKELASENNQVTKFNDRVCQDVDQHSQLQPIQLSKVLATDCRKPTLFSAKRKLSYEHLHEIPTSKLCNSLTESSQINTDSSNQNQQSSHTNEQFESSIVVSKESCDERERIKVASSQMQSSHSFTPSCKVLTSFNSLKAVSPLTKAFKSILHMQGSQPSLKLQQPSHALSTATASHPVMIPSFSVPCLLSPHPVPHAQTFILNTPPPLHSQISKSPSLVSSQKSLTGTSVGSNLAEVNTDVYASTRVPVGQPSSGNGVAISYSTVVYATPTSSNTNSRYSMISDTTSPNPGYSKSAYGKSSNTMTLESMLRGQRQSADRLQGSNLSVRNQSSNTRGVQLKHSLLPGSSQQPMQQQQEAQSSLQCPRMIHCSNCGHKIDLKSYIQTQRKTGKSEVIAPAYNSIPTKLNVTTAGLTVFDLEAICDTGCIDQNLPIPTTGKQQAEKGSNTMFCCITNEDYNRSSNFGKQSSGIIKPRFPHSDELTWSFAPIQSDCVSGCTEESTLAESWGKLDTLDIDEMLQLLETTSEMRYCNNHKPCTRVTDSKFFGKIQTEERETSLKSVQPANHIVTEDYSPCYELHSPSGKTSQSGKFGIGMGKLVRYPTADGSNDSGKSDNSNSDGEVVWCEEAPDGGRVLRSHAKQPTSRICKRRPRKKHMKKTSHNQKKDKQKATA